MTFEYNGTQYKIRFKHYTTQGRRGVWCFIISGPKEDENIAFAGSAECSPNDRYEKEKGRKLALRRATALPFPSSPGEHKMFGRAAWTAYMNRTKASQ